MLGLTGCNPKKPLLQGTVLEDARVFDADGKCTKNSVQKYENLEHLGLISNYLTEEKLKKAINDEITDEEIASLVSRVLNEETEELHIQKNLQVNKPVFLI